MGIISGIYLILNKANGKLYLGQSQDIRTRWKNHKKMLNGNRHSNKHLQRAWNKYGAKAFQFKILERCAVDELDTREQHYLDVYMPKGMCYNSSPSANTTRGIKHTEEARRNMSKGAIKRFSDDNERRKIGEQVRQRNPESMETRLKKSLALKGKQRPNDVRVKISNAKGHLWIVTNPDGISFEIKSLSRFCRENSLSQRHMWSVSAGLREHHKGWRCRKLT